VSPPAAAGSFSAIRSATVPTCRFRRESNVDADETGSIWTLYTDNQKAEVDRLISIGAKRYPWRYRPGADFVVLEDPDGNLFCLVQKG